MSTDSSAYPRQAHPDLPGFSDETDDHHSFSREHSSSKGAQNQAVFTRTTTRYPNGVEEGDDDLDEQEAAEAELEMMKERFAKLLLGEDMSGSGKGVCTAVTISNAITNLYATVFGQSLRLQPLDPEKRALWKREMNCFLPICDYIMEVIPRSDGPNIEVLESRLRSDILMNLPALKKLDAMLIDILDSFYDNEFWYAERGSSSMNSTCASSGSFRKVVVQRKDEKWWLPVPCVPAKGLSEDSRKHLRHKRDCANQIHKAAMAINDTILGEMDTPESYLLTLPKSGKASVGDMIYKYMSTAEKFSPDFLLDGLNIKSEHDALELAGRVEASLCTWKRKAGINHSKSSWDMTNLVQENESKDKNHILASRAKTLLFCLKQRYPELSQTSLDICKIQYNRDVGKAVLESYSRVLEGLAYNIVSWIDDVLYVDKTVRNQGDYYAN